MGVSTNNGTSKWMVYNGKPYEQMEIWGVKPLFLGWHPNKPRESWDSWDSVNLVGMWKKGPIEWPKPRLFAVWRGWNTTQLYTDYNKPL